MGITISPAVFCVIIYMGSKTIPMMRNSLYYDYAVQRRSKYRWAGYALTWIVIAAAAAYAALPVWVPTGWIAGQFIKQLSTHLHRRVGIEHVSIGWIDGLVFEDITIAEHPGWPNGLFARVGRLRCGFTPLTSLLTGQVNRIEIVDPQIWVVVNQEGKFNIDDLRQGPTGSLPSLAYTIRQAACHVLTPQADQTFKIDNLQCMLEPGTGLLNLFGEAKVTRPASAGSLPPVGRLSIDAEITVPQLKKDVVLGGEVHIEWTDLTLTDLPVPVVSQLPIEQVAGISTGQLTLSTHPDLGIDYNLFISMDGVSILRNNLDRPGQVPDATLACKGHWDPNIDMITMRDFDCETRAIHVHKPVELKTPALLIDSLGEIPFKLDLEGRIKDWLTLRREFPEIDALARTINADFTGSDDFTICFTQSRDQDRLVLTVAGQKSQWIIAAEPVDYLSAGPDVNKSLYLEWIHDHRTGEFRQPQILLQLGDLSLSASSKVIVPESVTDLAASFDCLIDMLPGLTSDITIKTERLEETVSLLPFLGRLTEVTDWHGPLEIRASVEPMQPGSQAAVALTARATTSLTFRDLFKKTPGEPVALKARLTCPHAAAGEINELALELNCGTSRMILESQKAELKYDFTLPGKRQRNDENNEQADTVVADASWVMPFRIEHVEGLLPLFPRWRRLCASRADRRLAGSADLTSSGGISYRPNDWLMNNRLELDAEGLAIQWDDQIDKDAGVPLRATFSHRCHLLDNRREQSLSAEINHYTDKLTGLLTFANADSDNPGNDFEQAYIRADIENITDWLDMMPLMRSWLTPYRPTGALTVELDSTLIEGQQNLSISADATGAAFAIPSDTPFDKPLGVAAAVKLSLRSDRTDSGSHEQCWELTKGYARLAGAELAELAGTVVTGWANKPAKTTLSARQVLSGRVEAPELKSATIQAQGTMAFDETLEKLHPRIQRWRREFDLAGHAGWSLRLSAEPESIVLNGHLDVEPINISVPVDHVLAPVVHKSPEVPARLDFDLSLERNHDEYTHIIDINNLALELDGNSVTTCGRLIAHRETTDRWRISEAQWSANLQIPHPARILALLPDSPIDQLTGRFEGSFNGHYSEDRISLGTNRLCFDRFAVAAGDAPLSLDGRISFDQNKLDIGQIRWSWGRSRGVASGLIHRQETDQWSQIGLAIEHLDLEDLDRRIASLPWVTQRPTQTAPAGRSELLAMLVDRVNNISLVAETNIDTLELVLPPQNVEIVADAVSNELTIDQGQAKLSFRCLVDGGLVTGSIVSNLAVTDPTFHLQYTAERIAPGAVVDGYLSQMFPGMQATGPLTLIDESYQKLLPRPGDPNFEVGKGQLIIEEGTIEGRAAPLWMTRIFPGLNLARFNFTYMHSWFEKFSSGRIRHQMIFQGKYYNIYMDGYSDPDRRIQYEVGIDFLADFDSRYWAETGQGRVPLFTKTGKVLADGSLEDETVVYEPRQFIIGVLVKNNPLITAYFAVRKRVLGQK